MLLGLIGVLVVAPGVSATGGAGAAPRDRVGVTASARLGDPTQHEVVRSVTALDGQVVYAGDDDLGPFVRAVREGVELPDAEELGAAGTSVASVEAQPDGRLLVVGADRSGAAPADKGWVRLYDGSELVWDARTAGVFEDAAVLGGTVYAVGSRYSFDGQRSGDVFLVATFDLATGEPGAETTWGFSHRSVLRTVSVLADRIIVGGDGMQPFASPGPAWQGNDGLIFGLDPETLDRDWEWRYDGPLTDSVADLVTAHGRVFAVWDAQGASPSSVLVGRFRSDGTQEWTAAPALGPVWAHGYDIDVIGDEVVVAGGYWDEESLSSPREDGGDVVVLGVSRETGEDRWATTWGTSDHTEYLTGLERVQGRLVGVGMIADIPEAGTGERTGPADALVLVIDRARVRLSLERPRVRLAPADATMTSVVLRNAGTGPAVLGLRACRPPRGVRLRFTERGREVTGAVTSGRYRTDRLAPGEVVRLRLVIQAGRRADEGTSSCDLRARTTSTPASTDESRLRIVVGAR